MGSDLQLEPTGGPWEAEADRTAEQVTRWSTPTGRRDRRLPGMMPPTLSAPLSSRGRGAPASRQVLDVLSSSGRPLDPDTSAHFTDRLGYDLVSVRVHHDEQAARSADSIGAAAYTVGNRIVFAEGRYDPGTVAGRHLLAHELAHTIQQARSPSRGKIIQRSPTDDAARVQLLDRVDAVAVESSAGASGAMKALTAAFVNLDAESDRPVTPEEWALIVARARQLFPVEIAEQFAEWVSRRQINPYEKAMEIGQGPHGNLLPGIIPSFLVSALLPAQARVHAFVDGFFEGSALDRATKARIVAKIGMATLSSQAFSGVFVAGALHGAAIAFVDLLRLPFQLPEILSALDQMVRKLMSREGEEAARVLGLLVGHQVAADLTSILDMSPPALAYWFGKKAGPTLVGILIAIVAGGIFSVAWRSWPLLRSTFDEFVDAAKMARAYRAAGVRIRDPDSRAGMVRIHKDGGVEWWVPAETITDLAPTASSAAGTSVSSAPALGVSSAVATGAPTHGQSFAIQLAGGPMLPILASDSEALIASGLRATVAAGQQTEARVTSALTGVAGAGAPIPGELTAILDRLVATAVTPEEQTAAALLKQVTPDVWATLQSPEAIARQVGMAEMTRQMLVEPGAGAANLSGPEQYFEAYRLLARSHGQDVMELHLISDTEVRITSSAPGFADITVYTRDAPGFVPNDVFLREVLGSGHLLLDRAALSLQPEGPHGATTHIRQGLAVGPVLQAANTSYADYVRALTVVDGLFQVTDPTNLGGMVGAGTGIWLRTFDPIGPFSQPEMHHPTIRDELGMPKGEY